MMRVLAPIANIGNCIGERTSHRNLLALRREEPALRPGDSDAHVEGTVEWATVLRIMPVRSDYGDWERSRRALLCVFNTFDQPLDVPIRDDAIGKWTLRFSTESEGYGGSGVTVDDIPDAQSVDVIDAPKRLMEMAVVAPKQCAVRMPPWSAAVFVRSFDE